MPSFGRGMDAQILLCCKHFPVLISNTWQLLVDVTHVKAQGSKDPAV